MPIDAPEQVGAASVIVARANLYLAREVCDAHLAGVQAVALLERDHQAFIVPLAPGSAGGVLLKLRNRHGDRVIHAQEFFRTHGYLEDFEQRCCPLQWNAELAALAIRGLPRAEREGTQIGM